jgi:hypothetical protein
VKSFFYITAFIFLFTACNKSQTTSESKEESSREQGEAVKIPASLDPLEYVKWVSNEQNGVSKSKTIDEVKYLLQYKPHDYLACMELKKDTVNKSEVEKKEQEFKGMLYFDFKIHIPNGSAEFLKYNISSTTEYQQRVTYCSFSMQYDISIVQNKDTIPCTMYLFERAFDVAPEGTFLLGFDEAALDVNKEMTFVFSDRLFKKGAIKFTFAPKVLNNIPKLKTV